jgi:predicted nicotinamide N-methyase
VELPCGSLRILQPREASELPDDGPAEWPPHIPYWSILWRSGIELARAVDGLDLRGRRVIELGCGLGLPSIAAARGGAKVLATDSDRAGVELCARNARENKAKLEVAVADWTVPGEITTFGRFDLVLAADVLYEARSVAALLEVMPALAPEALIAEPGRPASAAFLDEAERRWTLETKRRGVVSMHRLRINSDT